MLQRLTRILLHLRPPQAHPSASIHNMAALSGRTINTAGCVIIGDEVLSSKTMDTNSAHFAKYCFELGIELKRIEVIADDEGEISEAVRRMSANYDMVVTSGGIGPTHDDITYPSIAKAFNQSLLYHDETLARMEQLSIRRFNTKATDEATIARKRMALFPAQAEVVFPAKDLWVPVVIVNKNIFILPGVPRLFTSLLSGLKPYIAPCVPPGRRQHRLIIATEEPESAIAPYLTELQGRVTSEAIKVGSYPKWQGGVKVSLLGRDRERLEGLVAEVERAINGKRRSEEDEENEERDRRQIEIEQIKRGRGRTENT